MDRLILNDVAWERVAPLILGRPDQKGSTGRDNRMFVEGVLWTVRTGSPWRDLPEPFGDWNSMFRRFMKIRPSAAPAMVWAPRSTWLCGVSAALSAWSLQPANAAIARRHRT